jgi:hypothetical protein
MTKKSLSDFLKKEVFLDAPKNTSDTAKKNLWISPHHNPRPINSRLIHTIKAELEVKIR